MRLFELLQDKIPHKKDISELKFLEMLHAHAKNSHTVVKNAPIYVQDDSKEDFFIVRPDQKEIKSAFWIDKLIEDLLSWKGYPDRKRCIRAHTSIEGIGNKSEAFVVIPFDEARIGICSTASFYRSFSQFDKFGIKRIDNSGLTEWIKMVVSGLNELDKDLNIEVKSLNFYVEFKAALKKIDSAVKSNHSALRKALVEVEDLDDELRVVMKDLIDRYVTSIDKYLDEKLDPHANEFEVSRIDSFHQFKDGDHEVWVSSPCLLVKRDKYIEMYNRGAVK